MGSFVENKTRTSTTRLKLFFASCLLALPIQVTADLLRQPTSIRAGTALNLVFDLDCLVLSPLPLSQRASDSVAGLSSLQQMLEVQTRTRLQIRARGVGQPKIAPHVSLSWIPSENLSQRDVKQIGRTQTCLARFTKSQEILPLVVANSYRPFANLELQPSQAGPDDPLVAQQFHLQSLGWSYELMNRLRSRLAGVPRPVIAVIDTGVDLDHADLHQVRWRNQGEIEGNGVDDDGNGYVDDVHGFNFASQNPRPAPESDDPYFQHGTHVAGLAAASVGNHSGGAGVAGFAQVMSLNVFGSSRSATLAAFENAVRYAADNGANVINLSIGGREHSVSMQEAIRYAIARGAIIVAATGNEGVEISRDPRSLRFVMPAAFAREMPGMISVGSTDVSTGHLSSFSNFGLFLVEISAPGALRSNGVPRGLISTLTANRFGELAGTSMSAPLVSGAAALLQAWLRARGEPSSPADVERKLLERSRLDDSLLGLTRHGKALDLRRLFLD